MNVVYATKNDFFYLRSPLDCVFLTLDFSLGFRFFEIDFCFIVSEPIYRRLSYNKISSSDTSVSDSNNTSTNQQQGQNY